MERSEGKKRREEKRRKKEARKRKREKMAWKIMSIWRTWETCNIRKEKHEKEKTRRRSFSFSLFLILSDFPHFLTNIVRFCQLYKSRKDEISISWILNSVLLHFYQLDRRKIFFGTLHWVTVEFGLGFVGQRGSVRVRILELSYLNSIYATQ